MRIILRNNTYKDFQTIVRDNRSNKVLIHGKQTICSPKRLKE